MSMVSLKLNLKWSKRQQACFDSEVFRKFWGILFWGGNSKGYNRDLGRIICSYKNVCAS